MAETALDLTQAGELVAIKNESSAGEFLKRVSTISLEAKNIKVKTDEDEVTAVECLVQIGQTGKEVEKWRVSKVDPYNKLVKAVNAFAKTFSDPLVSAKSLVEKQVQNYRTLKRIEQQKAQEKAQKEADKLNAKMAKAGVDAPPVQVIVAPVQNTTRTEIGSTFERKEWKHEVVDIVELCRAVVAGTVQTVAVQANDQYIRALVKGGARDIPGVRIFEESKLQTRSA